MIAGAETEIISPLSGGAGEAALIAIAGALIVKAGGSPDGVSGRSGP